MKKPMTFNKKVLIGMILIVLIASVPLGVLGFLALNKAEEALETQSQLQLNAVRQIKKEIILDFFADMEADVEMLARSLEEYEGNYEGVYDYLERYKEKHSYYDLFLINQDGHVFYSVTHEADYNTNMVTGPYADSGLGQLFREVKQSGKFGLTDFKPYAPSNGDPAAFVAYPIKWNGQIGTVLALQVPLDEINETMHMRKGMGETGKTYLVGPDLLMRSDSKEDPENRSVVASFRNPSKGKVDTEAVRRALAGESGILPNATDFNGDRVIASYEPFTLGHINWAVIAEIDMAEVDKPVMELRNQILVIAGMVLLFVVGIVSLIIYAARGEIKFLGQVVADLTGSSEQVASASDQISSGAQQLSQGATEQAASLEQLSASMEEISSQAQNNASSSATTAESVRELDENVTSTSDDAASAAELAEAARAAAERGAQAMEQISTSMKEITDTSTKVSDIIDVINEITHQTKMLATNAAIEAARAGEQGKGFAVVADEVSKLAESSKSSAKEIAGLIKESNAKAKQGSQYASDGEQVLAEILEKAQEVAGLVNQISEYAGTSNKKVKQVTQLVSGINTASTEQASGIEQVSDAIAQLDEVTQNNAANAEESASAAEELNSQAESLKDLVKQMAAHFGVERKRSTQGNQSNVMATKVHHLEPVRPAKQASPQAGHPNAPRPALPQEESSKEDRSKVVKPSQSIPMRDDFADF